MWCLPRLIILAAALPLSLCSSAHILSSTIQARHDRLARRTTDITKNEHAVGLNIDELGTVYSINITLGGQDIVVALDTGSVDLWVQIPQLQTTQSLPKIANITYEQGSVSGPIEFAPLEIAGFNISNQAFIHANSTEDVLLAGNGIIGLGFDAHRQSLFNLVHEVDGPSSTKGRSTISNIFASNSSLPNFFTVLLRRPINPTEVHDSVFTIGEYVEAFSSVVNSPQLASQIPNAWSVLVDGIKVGGQTFQFNSTVSSAPTGKTIAALDTGSTFPAVPAAFLDAIYGGIPGAVKVDNVPGFRVTNLAYVVPCNWTVDVSFTFGGVDFPIHPLDLTLVARNSSATFCYNSFKRFDHGPNDGFSGLDMILGQSFLRNAYISFNYGSFVSEGQPTKSPFLQMLPTTNINQARSEFAAIRGKQLQGLPKELSPSSFKNGGSSQQPPSPTQTAARSQAFRMRSPIIYVLTAFGAASLWLS